ncbi:MAG: 50S ribosomal protein L24 [bacterium]|jgi:large subunit ribosomal protein L24|nr:50S ribosomal protein L24 [Bacillota bacterium]HHW54474.1 50S ribosomal protein L24 [Bacillota bacterium]
MQPRLKIKKGDTVLVLAGKDKGEKGKVLQVIPSKRRVIVEGVNLVKKHTRATPQMPQGGIVTMEAPIHVSNVMLVCTKCGKPTRTGAKVLADGKKVRVCKRCEEVIDK